MVWSAAYSVLPVVGPIHPISLANLSINGKREARGRECVMYRGRQVTLRLMGTKANCERYGSS